MTPTFTFENDLWKLEYKQPEEDANPMLNPRYLNIYKKDEKGKLVRVPRVKALTLSVLAGPDLGAALDIKVAV